MSNLSKETHKYITKLNKEIDFCVVYYKPEDEYDYIVHKLCTYEQFREYADMYFSDYDDGYGSQEVPEKTVIVFKDKTWLSRWEEYDGSEGWQYNECPSVEDYI
jgi:hypothetical protein